MRKRFHIKIAVSRRVRASEAQVKRVQSRWIDGWIVRSRLVAQEFATGVRYDTFASTPPLKAAKSD